MSTKFSQAFDAIVAKAGSSAAATFSKLWGMRDATTDQVIVSQAAISEKRGIHERTFRRHVERLVDAGHVIVDYEHDPCTGYRTSCRYSLALTPRDACKLVVARAAALGRRGIRAIERAARRASALAKWRTPTGQFCPRSISQDKIKEWMQPVVVSNRLLQSKMCCNITQTVT